MLIIIMLERGSPCGTGVVAEKELHPYLQAKELRGRTGTWALKTSSAPPSDTLATQPGHTF